jgi:hypothetical protein
MAGSTVGALGGPLESGGSSVALRSLDQPFEGGSRGPFGASPDSAIITKAHPKYLAESVSFVDIMEEKFIF